MAEVENTGNSFNIQNDNGDVVNMFPTTTGASSQNLYNEQVSVGNGITGPKPQTSNNRQAAEQLLNNILVNNNNTTDRYAYAKPTTFNSTHTGLNFDRYYNHPNFKKLGFSPYRDNETIYNKNSSWSDDFRRASTQYGTLWGNGFSSLFKNWGSLASSTPDFEGAHTMEKAMAIGSSSKDNFGASFTNFYLNSAYTVGVLSEIAVEEIGLVLATVATGSMAAPAAVARTAINVGRFSKAIGNLFKGAKNVSTARKVWNVAKKIIPFGDTADLARGIIAGDRATLRGIYKTENSLDAFAKSKALFGQFYRDTREINAASAESKLEAGMVSNQVSADLINKFYAENGRMPNDAESKMIYDRAQRAGAESFLYNMPAIYFSNKIVLETAFKGIKPLRNIIGEVPGRLRPVIQAGKDGKKIAKILDLDATKTYFTKDYWKNIGKAMSPKKILGAGLRYTSANITEGLQEVYQESLSAGLVDHYTNQNWGTQRIGEAGLWNSLKIGAKELDRNNMALETFLSGFLMAAPIGGIQTIAFKKAPQLLQRIAKPEQYKQQQKTRQNSINALENALTDLVNDPTKWANDFHANATKQNQLAMEGLEAEQAGDVKAAKDAQEESMFNHMYTMLQHNMMGEFRDQMKDLLTLNDTELQEAFGGTKGTNNADTYNSDLRSRINKSIASSEKLEERYKKANDTFFNPFNRENVDEFIDYYGFEEAKKLYVFNEHMFEQTVDRAQSIFNNLSANEKVSQLVAGNISSILDTRAGGQLDQLINLLKQEIKTYEGGTKEDIKLAEEKKKQLEGLEEWKNAATAYEQAYDSMTMAGLDPEQAAQYVEEAKRFPRGATVEYTNQKGEKVQGKVVSKAGSNIILEIINKAGRKQRVAIKVEKAAVVGQLTLDFDAKDLEGQDMVDSLEYLFQALFGKMEGMGTKGIEGPGGYMQTLAGAGGLNMTREEMAEVFNNIMDYFRLKKDSMTHLNAINRLADPGFFASSAERIGTAQKAAKRIAELKIKVMLADFEKIQDRHILLQELFELGVFLDPKDVDGLINDKKIPSSFYTATNVDGIPELTFIDPLNKDHQSLYKKIIDVLEAYETKEGVAFTGKVDVNIFQQALSGQLGQVYRKTTNDSRTIKDLAKEYGFNVDETSEVDVKELFQKIINSDYGRPHDKVLARRLLATIPEGFKIKFDRNHGVGVSYDSTNGVIVNPNFSAENYQGGQVALESLILNGVMQKLVADNLSNKEFKTAIEKIKAQVAEALANGQLDEIIAELKSKYDIVFTDSSGKVVVNNIAGMRSLEQFVAMAMTDPAFQSLLGNVTVEETQKTLWEEFLDVVKLLVQTLTGMAPGTTALEETINLTTAALTGSNITTTTEETPVATKPTVATPLNSMPEELRTALQTAWTALSPEDKSGYTDISEWVKGSSAAASIINKYNKQKEQKEAETRTEEELKLAALTPQQLSYLRNKSGLNDKDIFAMAINELVEIANSKFRILNEGEKLTASQVSQGVVVKEFNGIKMTNATVVNPAFTEDPIIAQKLTQVGSALEQLLANALGRGDNKKVTLLDNATKSLAEQIIGQIEAIYNIKDLEFTEEMGSKIRLLLSDKSTFFFRVTSLKDIVEDIRNSSKAELPQKLSEAIQNLLTKAPATEQMKAGADRGLVFDEFFRLTLQGTLNAVIDDAYVTNFLNQALENTKKTLNVSQEIILTPAAIAELRQTLEHIVAYMKENNLRALTSTNELFGNIGVMPVSGQVDIIIYNDKGELFILDMKTMSSSLDRAQMEGYGREVTGKTKDDRFGYASKDTAQLNIYRELIQALVGVELQKAGMQIKGLGIIPLLVNASLNNSNELIIKSIKLSDPIREDSAGTRGLYIPVLEKTTIELFPELYAQAPPAAPATTSTQSTQTKKAEIEKQKEAYKKLTKGTPINKDAPKGIKVGDRYNDRLAIINVNESLADNYDKTIADNNGLGYEVISKVEKYGEMENGVQTKAPKVETIIFNNKADADAFFVAEKIKLDKYIADAELKALKQSTTTSDTQSTDAKKADIERRVEQTLSTIIGSTDLFNFDKNQKGKTVRGEFIPDNLGEQIFNAINKTLKGEVEKVDKPGSNKLFRELSKKLHPDKHQDPFIKLIAEKFFKAATLANSEGYIRILQEIEKSFDAELKALETTTTQSTEAKKAEIVQTNKPTIQTIGNVTSGTANKQGQTDNNEDAVYVDTENGIFILADGMGGEGMLTHSASQTSKSVINKLLGKKEQNFTDLIYEEYLKNKDITSEQISDFLISKGFKKANTAFIAPMLAAFKTRGDLTGRKGFRTGATALKAEKVGKNTYKIEKVGDTVYFVVDKNGKVTQSHGLSNVATTQGYMFSIRDGKPYVSNPKTDNFTVTLNEGETLVLATDFIETDKAIQDFINSDFGKNLNFESFQKNNKVDDSTFITIRYDAKLKALEESTTPQSTQAKKAEINNRWDETIRRIERNYLAGYNNPNEGYGGKNVGFSFAKKDINERREAEIKALEQTETETDGGTVDNRINAIITELEDSFVDSFEPKSELDKVYAITNKRDALIAKAKAKLTVNKITKDEYNAVEKELDRRGREEIKALEGGGQQAPTSTSVINQEILNEYAGQVIYVSPGIKISKELANDPNVILYDDFIIGILNQHLDELGVEEFTQENLFANLGEIFGSKNKSARNKLTSLLNNDVYNAAINELAENPEKILITQSNIFTKEAGSNVAVAIVPESLESYDNKGLALLEQKEFRKNSRLRTTKSTDLQEILKNPLTKLDKQRDLTARGESATYEEFIKQAEFDSLILLVTELDTMEDGDFIFEQEVDGKLRDQKNYLYTLIKTELQKRMKDGIITKNELLKVAKEGDIVIMANTELYARGLGVVTKKGNIKAIYYNESASDDFKQFGLPPSESNKVIGVEQLAEILEEEATTENENFQAAENTKTINKTVTKEDKVQAVNDATSANEEADKIEWC